MKRDTEEKDEFPITTNTQGNTPVLNNKGGTSSKGRLWSGLKDPRIVRVSRAFGGKDRHSKVSTIRGLRDRRVRLSVPTAIQLYDLQDRLGLNQPSKVVDWLLNAAQNEINKLPPLDFSVENFIQFHHQSLDQASKGKNNDHDHCFHAEEEHQFVIGSAASMYQLDVGINNARSSIFHQDNNLSYINSRGGGGDNALDNGGFPYASSYYHWDQPNRTYLSQIGIISSQLDVASASCELDGNSYLSGSPKPRLF